MTRSLAASTAARYWLTWAALSSWLPSANPRPDRAAGAAGSISGGVWNGSQPGAATTGAAGPMASARRTERTGARNRRGTALSFVAAEGQLLGRRGEGVASVLGRLSLFPDHGPDESHHDEQPGEHGDE